MTSIEYEGTTSFDFLGETISSSFDGIDQKLDLDFSFTENPNEYTTDGSYDLVVGFTVQGMTETEITSVNNLQQEGT